jgi:hypothetical protein
MLLIKLPSGKLKPKLVMTRVFESLEADTLIVARDEVSASEAYVGFCQSVMSVFAEESSAVRVPSSVCGFNGPAVSALALSAVMVIAATIESSHPSALQK